MITVANKWYTWQIMFVFVLQLQNAAYDYSIYKLYLSMHINYFCS